MMRHTATALLLLLLPIIGLHGEEPGERKVTPVENEDGKPEKPRLHYYDRHGKPLPEPVYVVAESDTLSKPGAKPVYPLLTSANFGANIMDAVMILAGQKYSNFDIWAQLSLHNWFFPTIELGIGQAYRTPENNNYTYTSSPGFFAKIGIDYNFLYKSSPDYNVFVGVRAGFSSFKYKLTDISISSDYWEEEKRLELPNQQSTAFYGEALAGLKVKIYRNFSLGWTLRYHFKFHIKDASSSSPWFIPGFGANNTRFSATFSLIYTLPIHNSKPNTTDKQ